MSLKSLKGKTDSYMTKRRLTIATRESPLALWQAESIKAALQAQHPQLNVELLGITTQADKRLDINLLEIGGKGLFVKELEEALLDGRADIAVHSMKDVPMQLPPGLILPIIGERCDPRDAFISNRYTHIQQLPRDAIIGTSSLRRQTQLRALRPDLHFTLLRGNIHTRLKRLDEGKYDAIILAAAGLLRMQLVNRIKSYLSIADCLPAAGQGALGIECREEDAQTLALIAPLNDEATAHCVQAERALCTRLGGGCKVPVAAYAHLHQGELHLSGLVANHDGSRMLRATQQGAPNQAVHIGHAVANQLLDQGAAKLLQDFL